MSSANPGRQDAYSPTCFRGPPAIASCLVPAYVAWFRHESDARFAALEAAERDRLLCEALSELRAGCTGETFSKWPEHTQKQIADRRARRGFARDLPSLEEWAAGEASSSFSEPAA